MRCLDREDLLEWAQYMGIYMVLVDKRNEYTHVCAGVCVQLKSKGLPFLLASIDNF